MNLATILIIIAAVGIDAALLLASRAYFSRHSIGAGGVQPVIVFGKEFRLLTFIKVQTNAARHWLARFMRFPDIRIGVFLVLLGAACVVAGQIMREQEIWTWVSGGLIIAGLAAFAGGVLLANKPLTLTSLLAPPARLLGVRPGQLFLLLAGMGFSVATFYLAGDTAQIKNPILSILSYLLGVAMVTAGAWQSGTLFGKNGRRVLLWAAGLMLVALALRIYHVGSMPMVMNGDEGTFAMGGVNAMKGDLSNFFVAGPFSYPILSFWIISLPIRILGRTVEAARMVSVLVGALTVGVTYLIARRMFNQTVALLAGVFLAFFHYHIQFSRLTINNIWDGLSYIIVLGCVWIAWREQKRLYFVIAGLVLGFAQYFYATSHVLVAVVLFYLAGLAIHNWKRFKQSLPDLVFMGLTALVVVLPLGLFFLKHPDELMAPYNRVSLSPDWFAITAQDTGVSALTLLLEQIKLSFQVYTDINFRTWYDSQTPMLLTIPAIFFFLGIILLFLRRKFSQAWLIGGWLLWITATGTLSLEAPSAQRYPAVAPAVALLVGYGLYACADLLKQFWPRLNRLWIAFMVVMIVWIGWGEFQHYFLDYIPRSFYDENTMTANYVAGYVQGKPEGTTVCMFTEPMMGFDSISSLPYLTPGIDGSNCQYPPSEDRPVPANHAVNVFFPNREDELTALMSAYPGGKLTEVPGVYRPVLLWVYDLSQ